MKYDLIAEAYLNSKIDIRKLPVADISHHRSKKYISESVYDWVNKGSEIDPVNINNVSDKKYPSIDNPDIYSNLSKEHSKNISGRHANALRAYVTGGLDAGHETGSGEVNKHLIDSHINKTPINQSFHFSNDDDPENGQTLNINDLDDALNQNKLHKNLVTYSGLGFNPSRIMQNNLLHLPAYTSSSTSRHVALIYARPDENMDAHILEIHHPKGSNGMYLGDNEDYTPFYQKEHLMPRGVTIQINPIPEIHEGKDGNKLHVWKAKRLLSLEKNK
jgi:hypothetical protein